MELTKKNSHYFVIGGGILQIDFIKTIQKHGYLVHVIDYDSDCIGAKQADYFHLISIDDKEKVLALAKLFNIVGIHTVATEKGNITACYVGEKLGLISNSYETALNTTNKLRMKKILLENNIDTPYSSKINNKLVNSKTENISIHYPFIVKPASSSGGRGVVLVKNKSELNLAIGNAELESGCNEILIEEYFDAPQFSIETLTVNNEHKIIAITKEVFTGAPDFIEIQDEMPASIDECIYKKIEALVFKTLSVFNIKCGACHIELRISDSQIKIIEIASRMGGWRHWMTKLALDIDYLDAIFLSTIGVELSIKLKATNKIAVAQQVINLETYDEYLKDKNNKNIIVDHVKNDKPLKNATNLVNTNGFYIYLKDNKNDY